MSHNTAASMAWAKRNPERVKEIKRRFRERHRERIKAERAAEYQAKREERNAAVRKWTAENPEMAAAQRVRARLRKMQRKLNSVLQYHYNVTAEQYQRLNDAQGGVCAICGGESGTARTKRLFVDHNHTTGRLRGLLCHACNMALGFLREDPAIFIKATAYLQAFEGAPKYEAWDDDAIAALGLSPPILEAAE